MSEEEFYKKLRHNFFGTEDSEDFKELVKAYDDKSKKLELYKTIIKEVREYIETKYDYLLGDDTFLDHDERIDRKQITNILEILDKAGETNVKD